MCSTENNRKSYNSREFHKAHELVGNSLDSITPIYRHVAVYMYINFDQMQISDLYVARNRTVWLRKS
jgi:hypothetical protein